MRNFDQEDVSSCCASPVTREGHEAPIATDVRARRVPVVAIHRVMMRQSPDSLTAIGRDLKDFISKRTRRAPVADRVVAYYAPALIVGKHRNVIGLRPIVAEGDNSLELMRSGETPHSVLVIPVVVADHNRSAVVAVSW